MLDLPVPSSSSLVQALVDAAPTGIAILDRNLRYVAINPAMAEINGLPVEAHLGRRIHDVLPALADELGPILDRVMRTGKAILDKAITGETPAAVGVVRHWQASYVPLHDAAGAIVGVGAVVVEVTDHRRLEDELRRLHDQARESQRAFEAIAKVHQAAIEAPSPTEMADQALRAVAESVGADRGMYVAIEAADGSARIIASTAAGPGFQLGSRVQLSSFALERLLVGEIASVENLATRRPTSDMERAAVAEGIASGMSVPLLVDGELEGAIHLGWMEPRSFTQAELDLLRAVTDAMAALVRHVRLFEGEREARRLAEAATTRARSLQAVTDTALEGVELEAFLRELLERLRDVTGTDTAGIMLRS